MEAVLQNSRNSLKPNSNPSTARFLIDHIRRLVEDDMKFTVEAFKLIENEIDVELNTGLQEKNFSDIETSRSRSSVRSKNSSQKSDFLRQNKTDQRNSFQGNVYTPKTTISSSKGNDSRRSMHGYSLPDSYLQGNDKITQNQNYVDSISYNSQRSQETKLHSQDLNYRENFSSIDATSTPNQHSISSLQDEQIISRSDQSAPTDTNSYKFNGLHSEYQPYCDESSSTLQILEAMRMQTSHERDIKEILNSILQKLNQFSNDRRKSIDHSGLETIANQIYDRRSANLPFEKSKKDEQKIPRFERPAAADTNGYKLDGVNGECPSYSKRIQTVEAMHADFQKEFQETMNKVYQKLSQCSKRRKQSIDQSDPESINTKFYGNLTSDSLSNRRSSQISFGTSRRSLINIQRNGRKIILPLLLAFGDNLINAREDAGGKGFTIIGERFARHDRDYSPDEYTENINQTQLTTQSARDDDALDAIEKFDAMEKSGSADRIIEIVEEKGDGMMEKRSEVDERLSVDRNQPECNKSRKSSESADKLTSTSDLNKLPHNEARIDDIVDIEETVSRTSTRNTEKTRSQDDELTDAISSSLLATPRTLKESSYEWTDLDEIALLISKASPNRRVIIKKKIPDVAFKGFQKVCNEKLIFCGNKITHVKNDRKTMCRQLEIENVN